MYTENESIAIIALMQLSYTTKQRREVFNKPKNIFQTETLNRIFLINKFPSEEVKRDLGYILNLSYKTVQIWFQNKRQRCKVELGNRQIKEERGILISHGDIVKVAVEVYEDIVDGRIV